MKTYTPSPQNKIQENEAPVEALKQVWTRPSMKKISSLETLSSGNAGSEGGGRHTYYS